MPCLANPIRLQPLGQVESSFLSIYRQSLDREQRRPISLVYRNVISFPIFSDAIDGTLLYNLNTGITYILHLIVINVLRT